MHGCLRLIARTGTCILVIRYYLFSQRYLNLADEGHK